MSAISRVGALRILTRVAENSDREDYPEATAEDFITMLFAAFEVAGSNDKWDPPGAIELLQAPDDFQFNRAELKHQTAAYVDHYLWMHTQQIDWLLANLLIAAEVVSTAKTWNQRWFRRGRILWGRVALTSAAFLIGWGVWLVICVAINETLGQSALWVWVALTAAYRINAWRQRRKNQHLLAGMAAVYEASRSATLSWAVIWDMLSKTRDKGAVWDPELYRLVEICMTRRNA